jgi:hypothetical protein
MLHYCDDYYPRILHLIFGGSHGVEVINLETGANGCGANWERALVVVAMETPMN